MKAMILAAGFGTRLRPLTDVLPKPMVPIANVPQLRYQLELLKAAGVVDVVVNLHHLAAVMPDVLGDGSAVGMRISYSREPEILGTGGGIKACSGFLTDGVEPFLVLNGDLLIDVSLADVVETHRCRGAVATMVLREDPRASFFGAIGVDADGRIVDFVGRARAGGAVARWGLFTGIHVMSPEVLDFVPEGPCGINETAYPELIRRGRPVHAYFQQGYWSDVGTPARYLEANEAVLGQGFRHRVLNPFQEAAWARDGTGRTHGAVEALVCGEGVVVTPPVVLGRGAIVEPGARIGPFAAIGAGARVGRNAGVAHAVVWAGAHVPEGQQVQDAVFWRRDGRTERLLVTRETWDRKVQSGSSAGSTSKMSQVISSSFHT